MGDRVSIQFINGKEKSVVFFSHWDGTYLPMMANEYVKLVISRGKTTTPLDRREPSTIMVDFIRWYLKKNQIDIVDGNYYLGKNENDGDNSDRGNFLIDLEE